jgi:hypothetical protein
MMVLDTIEIRPSAELVHAPGLVAVLDAFPSDNPDAFVGRDVRLHTPDGQERIARIEAVRDHGVTISFFFRNLSKAGLPLGSRVEFEE